MKNFIQEGESLNLLAPYAVSSGDGFQVGSLFAVAASAAINGAAVVGIICGVFDLAKTSAQAWTVGQKIYWDNSLKVCTTDGTLGMLIGTATAIAANPTATGYVRLNGAAPASSEGPQPAIVALTDNTGGSGTHDDTLADGLTVTALTGTLTGVTDGVMEDVAATAGACAGGATPTATQVDTAIATAVASIVTGVNLQLAELYSKINTLVTDVTVQNQNDSDIAQKVLEIRTALIAAGVLST